MKRKFILTNDGSHSLYVEELDEHYHSTHGAIQEAKHVFLKMGLELFKDHKEITILETGLGTGLNCFLTYLENKKENRHIKYIGFEAYPITQEEYKKVNYLKELKVEDESKFFDQLHLSEWEKWNLLHEKFSLLKREEKFKNIDLENEIDLIYFDAFGPRVQPKLWTIDIFTKMYKALRPKGALVTYCAKGQVRRNMQEVGFTVERLEGPPGKREMLRATKL